MATSRMRPAAWVFDGKTCEKPSVQAEKYLSSLEGKIKEVQTLQLECNASSVTEQDASNYLGFSNLLFPGAPRNHLPL